MAVIATALRRLFPSGNVWKLTGNLSDVLDALALSIQAARDFLAAILTETIPIKSVSMLEEWRRLYNLTWYDTTPLATKQARVNAAHTSIGGQSLEYIQGQIQKEYSNVFLNEFTALHTFTVTGMVPAAIDYTRLSGMVERLAPAHLVPVYEVSILSTETSALTGRAICGLAVTGRAEIT